MAAPISAAPSPGRMRGGPGRLRPAMAAARTHLRIAGRRARGHKGAWNLRKVCPMSRLDSYIRRLVAQRDILNHVATDLDLPRDGPILEIGLGNGRTYDHLRELFPARRIVAFDRALAAHASSVPPEADLVLGEIRDTARAFAGGGAALVHVDIGTGYPDRDAVTLTWLPDLVASALAGEGVAASGLPLDHPALQALPLPPGIAAERYFLYRRAVR